MKKIIYSTMMASLLALTGCQSEELVSDNSTDNSGKTVILTANIQGSPTTRVALTPDTDENENPIVKVAWREYDPENPETFIVIGDNAETFFTQISGTEFTGTLPVPTEWGIYLAVYNSTLFENFGKRNEFTFRQDGTLREQDMVMSSMFDADDTSIEFKHQMSILKPTFTVDGENINSSITHIEMGKIYACTTIVVIDVEPTSPATTLKDDIYLTIPLMNDLSGDESNFQAGETFDFAVTAGGKDYTGSLTIPAGMNIEAGNLYTASVQMNIVTTPSSPSVLRHGGYTLSTVNEPQGL